MAATMSQKARDEYLEKMRERYARMSGRQARSRLLDEFCEVTGHERKYATKLLGAKRRADPGSTRRGRPPIYGEAEKTVLKAIWKACEQPCGKRLKPAVQDWLPAYEKREGEAGGRSGRASSTSASASECLRSVLPRSTGFSPRRK